MAADVERVDFGAGPWIQVACLCERATKGKNGHWTIEGLVETVQFQLAQPPPAQMVAPERRKLLTLFVRIATGEIQGLHELVTRHRLPDGISLQQWRVTEPIKGDRSGGIQWTTSISPDFGVPGDHWFEVSIDGQALTKFLVKSELLWQGQKLSVGLQRLPH